MKRHNRSFFGQKSGIIFDSGDWNQECIYLTLIQKLPNGSWEKPSEGQGKKIKLNLGEIIMMRRIFMGIETRWSTVHRFNEDQTSISVSADRAKPEQFWINVDSYRKNIRPPETEILLLLLAHVIDEKIEFATGTKTNGNSYNQNKMNQRSYGNTNNNSNYTNDNQGNFNSNSTQFNRYNNNQENNNSNRTNNHQDYRNFNHTNKEGKKKREINNTNVSNTHNSKTYNNQRNQENYTHPNQNTTYSQNQSEENPTLIVNSAKKTAGKKNFYCKTYDF